MKRALYPLALLLVYWRSRGAPHHLQRFVNIKTGVRGWAFKNPAGTVTLFSDDVLPGDAPSFGWDYSLRYYIRKNHLLLLQPGELQ